MGKIPMIHLVNRANPEILSNKTKNPSHREMARVSEQSAVNFFNR